jgi:CRP-like cAMP-binding protein
MQSQSPAQQFHNRILASLPRDEIEKLSSHLSFVDLPQHKPLLDERLSCGYFLEYGIASFVITLYSGETVEVGAVGSEGVIGLSILLGARSAPIETFMQVGGSGFRIPAGSLKYAFDHCAELRRHTLRYMQAFMIQIAHTAACNRLHTIEARMARWLLTYHDRAGSDEIHLTHAFLAQMLGAPRTTITQAAGLLQRSGLIACTRGTITITDRQRLEKASCECYKSVRESYRQLGVF